MQKFKPYLLEKLAVLKPKEGSGADILLRLAGTAGFALQAVLEDKLRSILLSISCPIDKK